MTFTYLELFAGVGAIGIEIDERYCEIAAQRLAQDTLMAVAE